jgi:V/A-type H+-transporting ATPase subunit D
MVELSRNTTVSRSAYLALKEEQQLVTTGYEFLDEKRILLAAEMLRQRELYRELRAGFTTACDRAAEALVSAAAETGLDGLQVHPVSVLEDAQIATERRPVIGQWLLDSRLELRADTDTPVGTSSTVGTCAALFRDILERGVRLAAVSANLERLMHEYRRTERRVRALENVVLPDIRQDITAMQEYLDLNEQEEIIRVRSARPLF